MRSLEETLEQISEEVYTNGFCVLDDILPKDLLASLASRAHNLPEANYSRAGIGRAEQYGQNDQIRRDSIHWMGDEDPSEQAWLRWCDELKQILNRRLFLGLFSFESHFARYLPGAFYKKHRDAFRGESNRKLSVLLYLNENWQDTYGGELVIYDDNDEDKVVTKVSPVYGRMVVFLSELFPHEVLSASMPRYSIAGWFRVNSVNSIT